MTAPSSRRPRADIAGHIGALWARPTFEPCPACGKTPSHYREKRITRPTEWHRLCNRCYGAAVRREQAAVAPLPRVIAAGSMKRITASVGRCGLCGLAAAAWKGEAGRLCDACYQRKVRRAVEQGIDVMTPTLGAGTADVRP